MRRFFVCLALALSLASCRLASAQSTTLSSETSNNTSACSAANSPAYCQAGFTGMSDSSSGTYNPAPGHVSSIDIHTALYSGNTTKIFAHFQPWFCMNGTSTATGTTSSTCNGHVQVGYNSNDANTIAGQAADMLRRGLNGVVLDWYGAGNAIADGTTAKFRDYLAPQCSGSNNCPLLMAIMEDQGAWSAKCPFNGNGTDQTNCITQALESDLDYMNANYFGSPAYLRVDNTTMSNSPNGHPVVFFFVCETCFTNPSPNWTTIWNSVRAHVLSYTTGDPVLWFIYRNATGFTHVQSDGAFAWVNHYGSNDPYGLVYLDNFYDTAVQNPTKQTYGGAWKGFDNTNAPWKPAQSITPQNCGQTWLSTLKEETHNSDFGINHQLPFLGLVTWNDYDEGTEVETGIDNCLSLTASVSGSVLSWTPTFSSSNGTEQTVDHYAVFDSTDGQNLSQVATLPAGTHSVDLTTVNLPSGSSTLYVEAVGAPFIQNRMSNSVTYPAAAADFSLSASPSSLSVYAGNISSAFSIAVSPINGFTGTVQLSATGLPTGASASFSVNPATTSSSMTVQTSGSMPAGAYTIAITGVSGNLTHTTAVSLVVKAPTFSISVSPTSASVRRGSAASFTVKVSPQGAFTGTVALTATGLPGGATANFSPSSITGSGSSTLAIGTSKTTKIGTYTIKVTGSSNGVTQSATVKLKVTS